MGQSISLFSKESILPSSVIDLFVLLAKRLYNPENVFIKNYEDEDWFLI